MFDKRNEVKSFNRDLQLPIALNCWKHHLCYIKCCLHDPGKVEVVKQMINSIGDSLLDLYTGNLDAVEISSQVIGCVESAGAVDSMGYQSWIRCEGKSYGSVKLSDGSTWTLRLGFEERRYIHLHPSRYSVNTLRVRGSTLKTVIAYLITYGLSDKDVTVEKVNRARLEIAKLPPIKSNSSLAVVNRIINLFFD